MMGADWGLLVVLTCCVANALAATVKGGVEGVTTHMDILMKGAKPMMPDAYRCSSYKVNEDEAYIVKFEALANASTAHHILMYGCQDSGIGSTDVWPCPPVCRGRQQIMFAWAKNAPPTQLPDGVGLRIGRRTSIRTIVLQIHYARSFEANEEPDRSGIRLHISEEKQPYVAGIFLMLSVNFAVPPNQPKYHVDVSCQYSRQHSMFPFAYRTHAHGLGSVITGYQYNNTGYHMIGKGNPQWPQAFYPTDAKIEVKPGDELVARCTYNSTGMNHRVSVGGTNNDEMCNFYIMFYTDASVENPYGECYRVEIKDLVDNLPPDSDVPLPPNPLLDEMAHGHHHHHHHPPSVAVPSSPALELPFTSKPELPVLTEPAETPPGELVFQSDWAGQQVTIGQVGGVATDSQGNVYIFHRGSRKWDKDSFDYNNNFRQQDQPIREDVVVILSREGRLIRKFGSGQYYMPHGITVDDKGNIWLTDVALHQVFKIPAGGSKPNMTLGVPFVHGDDAAHFCKPTDVAVLASGDFYVSDGYCNSRVMKFSKNGVLSKQWGQPIMYSVRNQPQPNVFYVPHSITVAEQLGLVCVADRENGRIQCFDLDGRFRFIIQKPEFGSRLFAVDYCPKHDLLYAVNGPAFDGRRETVSGFTINLRTSDLLETWNLPTAAGLQNPHDVAVDVEGHAVYVGELNPKAVWKFQRRIPSSSTVPTTTARPPATEQPTPQSAGAVLPDDENNVTVSEEEDDDKSAEAKVDSIKSAAAVESVAKKKMEEAEEEESSDFTPSIIIGVLLIIPVVLLLVITLIMRWHHRGWDSCFSSMRTPKVFNLQNFLGNSHRGFDKLSQEDSDHDADVLSDSDNEEFRQPMKSKA